MPTYEYRCRACGHELEAVQSFTDDALTECPSCGGQLRKVFGSIGVTFKGSGFYKTDSRPSGSSATSSSGSGTSSDGSGSSTSDSKTSGDSGSSGSSGSSGGSDSGTPSSTPSSSPA